MKKLLLFNFLFISTFSYSNDVVILYCELEKGMGELSINFNSNKVKFNLNKIDSEFDIDEVNYNKMSRYQSEFISINLPNGIEVFRSYDSVFDEDFQYGFSGVGLKGGYCKENVVSHFGEVSNYFSCNKDNALGC